MNLTQPSTALFVKDIKLSKAFYTGMLDMHVELDFGKNIIFKGGLAIWEINESHIIPKTLGIKNITDQSRNRFEIYFETEDLDTVHDRLIENKVKLLHGIHEEIWGQRTIRFFDPDDHLIEVGESMKQFVTRLYKQGLTYEQVFERTHVPVEEVKRLTKDC